MAVVNFSSPSLRFSPQQIQQAERADLAQRDAFAAALARRMAVAPRTRRLVAVHLRRLAWPVWVGGRQCLAAVTIHYILSRPRERQRETFWYADVAQAHAAHPTAVMLPDVDRVQSRIRV